ncbi:MAG: xanthine phosphoribosyltransferase [Lachnospiraceae bacterium]
MKLLEDRIRKDGIIKPDHVLKVDSFLNHQMDVELIGQMADEWKRLFANDNVNKILTIEASGIGIACIVAERFHVPVVYAKRAVNLDIDGDVYETQVESFNHKKVYDVIVSKKFLNPEDRVLIIDDFLCNGHAVSGMVELVQEAGATVVGVGVAIEKGFNIGGKLLRENGIRVESLAILDGMNAETGEIYFHD